MQYTFKKNPAPETLQPPKFSNQLNQSNNSLKRTKSNLKIKELIARR